MSRPLCALALQYSCTSLLGHGPLRHGAWRCHIVSKRVNPLCTLPSPPVTSHMGRVNRVTYVCVCDRVV